MGKLVYLKNVATLQLNVGACSGCGMCAVVCPRGVLEIAGGHARIFDRDSCIECGACALNCPEDALTVRTGVGCASAVIYSSLGLNSGCCCSIDQYEANGKNSAGKSSAGKGECC
ncbi:MAG: mercury methylation ferredoxin HgcB [Syntrophobacteraceae bacterium]|nr:mercury methylation ferredoxin HgcB [Syntrophobacteraceae bacterium]